LKKAISTLVENLNSGLSYLIATVNNDDMAIKNEVYEATPKRYDSAYNFIFSKKESTLKVRFSHSTAQWFRRH
jgi:hypothetical protein